ncbi:MAG TPA: LD-carboxypeptidase [Prolixibacteraceae bacterium]|nr:LD-carboxypeptidase [Prolixibacteraceae bacterium]
MNHPPFLQPGDKIAMVSAAGKVSRETVEKAKKLLEDEKFVVGIGPHAFDAFHMFAGVDADRATDVQNAMDDSEVKAIFFTRGGYGSFRTLVQLDWSGFFEHPKWLAGFSDITVFHSYLSARGMCSIHGVMPAFFFENEVRTDSLDRMLDVLRGKGTEYQLQANRYNRTGKSQGVLVGGNLSVLSSLRSTPLDQTFEGKVLFIEDILEYDYHIDRMMMNLLYGNALSNLAGLIVGYISDTKTGTTPFGLTALEIIREAVTGFDYPVVYGFPAGHELPNYPLVMGMEISLDVTENAVVISQSFLPQSE